MAVAAPALAQMAPTTHFGEHWKLELLRARIVLRSGVSHPGAEGGVGLAQSRRRVQGRNTGDIMAKPKRGRSTATIDDHVGARIRERRIMLGLTQQQLAEMIGVTYQQAHKYERGINRVSAGRLFEIARALSAPISYFYEGVGQEGPRQITPHQRMLLEIARNFAEIRNERHQEAVSQLARALASR
jgi:transcriptional regulator with XRE-family HTH domain